MCGNGMHAWLGETKNIPPGTPCMCGMRKWGDSERFNEIGECLEATNAILNSDSSYPVSDYGMLCRILTNQRAIMRALLPL